MNSVLMIILLGLLLITLVSPFSALALLMLVVFISALSWVVLTLMQTLVGGREGNERS